MADKSKVIDYLKRFNRKERFILLSHVLGQQAGEAFRLNPEFRKALACKLGLAIPGDAFVAMDYHLDWIQMALHLADQRAEDVGAIVPNDNRLISAKPTDVDLLVAFVEEGTLNTRLLLIEAKADTSWTNKQLEPKANRLSDVFGKTTYGGEVVKPHLVLMSPRESVGIKTEGWPPWMMAEGNDTVHWLELPLRDDLLKVTRCDREGRSNKDGDSLLFRRRQGKQWVRASPSPPT